MAADRRPGNLAHLERLLNAWSRDKTDVQATAGRLRRGGSFRGIIYPVRSMSSVSFVRRPAALPIAVTGGRNVPPGRSVGRRYSRGAG